MKNYICIILLAGITLSSCMKEPVIHSNDVEGNFNALWEIIDKRYCYLDYKGIDWNYVHAKYSGQLSGVHSDRDLFDLLGNMLAELKDGHVNLYSDFDISRYWNWYSDYPANFNSDIIYSEKYLGDNYKITGGLNYGKIHDGKIGYVHYESFMYNFGDEGIKHIFEYFKDCSALIIDVRNNGGGSTDLSEQLASYFFTETTLTGYIINKTGAGHSDFSKPVEVKLVPHPSIRWQKPVAVLTNRMSYSATNDFVCRMKLAPHAIIVGDKTGGGGGFPLSSELPNGWMVRFSSIPMLDADKNHIEFGIDPDFWVNMDENDKTNDAIIEEAIQKMGF
jgi:C-terminal processing protease CtpA/Prc